LANLRAVYAEGGEDVLDSDTYERVKLTYLVREAVD
jgi:hypothetical protein